MTAPRIGRLPRGFLVAVEGIDGAGKTTQTKMLAGHFASMPFEVVCSKEPTAGPWGDRIRASAASVRMSAADELDAFTQDRREHVAGVIQPALDRGAVVILDRYYFSTAAYQGSRGLDAAAILASQETFAPRPDVIVIVKLPPETAITRIGERGGANTFETLDALRAVDLGFDALGAPYRIARVDGTPSPLAVHAEVREAVLGVLAERIFQASRSVETDDSIPMADKARVLREMLVTS